jgi:hypothetical protein
MCCTRGRCFPSGKGIFHFGTTFRIGCRSNSASLQWKSGRSTKLVTHLHLKLKVRMCIVRLLPWRPCQFAWHLSVSLTDCSVKYRLLVSNSSIISKQMYKKWDSAYQYLQWNIWGSHSGHCEDSRLVGCHAVWSGINLLTHRKNTMLPFSHG